MILDSLFLPPVNPFLTHPYLPPPSYIPPVRTIMAMKRYRFDLNVPMKRSRNQYIIHARDFIHIVDYSGTIRTVYRHEILNCVRNEAITNAIMTGAVHIEDVCDFNKNGCLRRLDVNIIDAVDSGNLASIQWACLDKVSVDMRMMEYFDNTVLHFACTRGRKDIVECLILHDARLNLVNVNGLTPLNMAVNEEKRHCIPPLLMNGAITISKKSEYISECKPMWDTMMLQMWQPTRDSTLECAVDVHESLVKEIPTVMTEEAILSAFIRDVPEAMHLMEKVMSFFSVPVEFDEDLNPWFLEVDGKLYKSVAMDILKAFDSTTERRLPLSYFASFINDGRREPFSEKWIREMMKVLVVDKRRCFGRAFDADGYFAYSTTIHLHLGSIEFDEANDIVSLAMIMDLDLYYDNDDD